MKFFLYCRKSSEDADKQVQSIDDQKKAMQEIARGKGIQIVKIFEESQSAKKPGRLKFSEMLRGIQEGKAEGILTWKIDRLARNPIDGGNISWMLQQGVLQKIITSDKEYCPTDNVLMMSVEMGMANQFILDLSKNTRRGLRSKNAKGWRTGLVPLGYLNDRLEKTVINDPDRFHLVRKMWDMMLTGAYTPEHIGKIAKTEWGMLTVKRKKSGGNPVSRATVYNIFKNPFYYGEYENGGELYKGKHQPMITRSEFNQVQRILGRKGNPRGSKKEFSFTGLLQCGECGCSITAEEKNKRLARTKQVKSYIYYHCTRKKPYADGAKCSQKSIEINNLEEQIIDFLSSLRISKKFIEWQKKWLMTQIDEETGDRKIMKKSLENKFENASRKMENLIKLKIEDPELFTHEEFKSQKNTIISEKNEAISALQDLDKRQNDWIDLADKTFSFCRVAKEKFENGTDKEKRLILSCIGSKIILKDGKLTIEAKKIFQTIQKASDVYSSNKRRFEPVKTRRNKPKEQLSGTENLKWLLGLDSNQ